MGIIRNIPAAVKLLHSLRVFNHYNKEIQQAKQTNDYDYERNIIADHAGDWAEYVRNQFNLTVNVTGRENLPKDNGFVVISNHQGYADIIAIMVALNGYQIGFMAKDNLEKVPLLGPWIKNIGGLFITRGNPREALKSMKKGITRIKNGFNLVIFPEGTRSKSDAIGKFKPGSFKLATKSKAPILPITISGSYHAFEEYGHPVPATINITIHPEVPTKDIPRKELPDLENTIFETIKSALPNQDN